MRFTLTSVAALAALPLAAAAAVPIHIAPFNGPSGKAATTILVADLETSGAFEFLPTAAPHAYQVTGTSVGGRIDASFSSPGTKLVFTRTYSGPGIKANAHRFADDIVHHVTGKPGIASASIAFVSDRSGTRQIYLCDADGSGVRQITSDPSPAVSPCLSPDGSYMTFTSFRSGYPDVEFIDLLTGSRQHIINSPGTNTGATIAPDGRRIALTKSLTGNPELYISHIGGGRLTRLTRTNTIESSPCWSPDGHELVYTSFASGSPPALLRIPSSGGKPERLPTGHTHSDAADWSPDGTRIAFEFINSSRRPRIAVLELDSGKVTTVAPGSSPSWAPNSRHLAFTTGSDLVLHDVDSTTSTVLVTTTGYLSEPSWTR